MWRHVVRTAKECEPPSGVTYVTYSFLKSDILQSVLLMASLSRTFDNCKLGELRLCSKAHTKVVIHVLYFAPRAFAFGGKRHGARGSRVAALLKHLIPIH